MANIRFIRTGWTQKAEEALINLIEEPRHYEAMVAKGIYQLFEIIFMKENIGYVIFRFDDDELVIMHVKSLLDTKGGVLEAVKIFAKDYGKKFKAKKIRVHSHRKGMDRALKLLGFKEKERVYEYGIW